MDVVFLAVLFVALVLLMSRSGSGSCGRGGG